METRAYLINQQTGQEIMVKSGDGKLIAVEGEPAEKLLSDIPMLSAITGIVSAVDVLAAHGYAFRGACGRRIGKV